MKTVKIRVPATTANMGPGFDSIGMAFKLYNYLEVSAVDGNAPAVEVEGRLPGIPKNDSNLIYTSIKRFYEEYQIPMPCIRLLQKDYIPLARGLGSSAACIVAGLVAANELSGKRVGKQSLATLAAKIEGHPDNSTPALVGGIVVGAMDTERGELSYIRLNPEKITAEVHFVAMIPDFRLATEKARGVLPEAYSRADAVYNSSRAALLTAAIVSGDLPKLAFALHDRIHQPYRMPLIPSMEEIFAESARYGAVGCFLSGAGPTLISVVRKRDQAFFGKMRAFLNGLPERWNMRLMSVDTCGCEITAGKHKNLYS